MKQYTISVDDLIVPAICSNGFTLDPDSQLSEADQRDAFTEAGIAEILSGRCEEYRTEQMVADARLAAAAMDPISVTVESGE